ncbi:hypothetical protein FOA52_015158 [Chlamydomonas sp. UWO 241]|nr:hypothetical protein FOA52_015158 [Chlamydomonas sp. UWO 241]
MMNGSAVDMVDLPLPITAGSSKSKDNSCSAMSQTPDIDLEGSVRGGPVWACAPPKPMRGYADTGSFAPLPPSRHCRKADVLMSMQRFTEESPNARFAFSWSLFGLGAVCIALMLAFATYADFDLASGDTPGEQIRLYYKFFSDVSIMVFVGFGFLMTFLRRYSYSAVGLNFAASALAIALAILCVGVMQQVWIEGHDRIRIDMPLLINALFAAASAMIAFGAVIGKTTPSQLTWLIVMMMPIYAVNMYLVEHQFKALDTGGALVVHMFGAYFGLSASLVFTRFRQASDHHGANHPGNGSSCVTDIFSMIGTLMLWIYWPSFNGALSGLPAIIGDVATVTSHSEAALSAQFLSVVNTFLSLIGSTLSTFALSGLIGRGKTTMMHVQNCTLAGGVAMGSACALRVSPGGAVLVGMLAGALSVWGFSYLAPFLERTIGLTDTCGVHNLHGMPSLLGATVAAIVSLWQHEDYLWYGTGVEQLAWQFATVGSTLAMAIAGGLVSGCVIIGVTNRGRTLDADILFDDRMWWLVEDEEAGDISEPSGHSKAEPSGHARHEPSGHMRNEISGHPRNLRNISSDSAMKEPSVRTRSIAAAAAAVAAQPA